MPSAPAACPYERPGRNNMYLTAEARQSKAGFAFYDPPRTRVGTHKMIPSALSL